VAVGVVRPRAVARPAGAWGRNRLTALERPADVAVGGSDALGSVHRLDAQVSDREAKLVEPSEHGLERCGDVAVYDELARMGSAVEAPVPDDEQPELRERDGAVPPPEAAFERRREGRGQGPHRRGRGVRLERDEQKRQGEDPQHGAGARVTPRPAARQVQMSST